MDYDTARTFILNQGLANDRDPDSFLNRLWAQQPPIAGQITSLLLALKMVYRSLDGTPSLSRELAAALHRLAFQGRAAYDAGRRAGVEWPLLLDQDLTRIAQAVESVLLGRWQGD